MERKDEAAVERQKLVDDGEAENDDDQTNISNVPPTSAPKSVQTPNSPVLSNRVRIHVTPPLVFFSFNTSRLVVYAALLINALGVSIFIISDIFKW